MTTREQVWQALFDRIAAATVVNDDGQTVDAFNYASRRMKLMEDNTPATPVDQPALFILEGNEQTVASGRGTPSKITLTGQIWVWCKVPPGEYGTDQDFVTAGSTPLNKILDAVDAQLAPDDVGIQELNLGGLVYYVKKQGETIKISGDLNPDGQCFAAIPIEITLPSF